MEYVYGGLPAWGFWLAMAITLFAGFVKGAVGFAMPLIMIATFSSFMPPELALAALILSSLVTNVHQSFRTGVRPALDSAGKFWRLLAMTVLGMVISAPYVVVFPERLMLALLGVPIMLFAVLQLTAWKPSLPPGARNPAQFAAGLIGGLYGGISGIWGPPAILYLLADHTPKAEMVRVLGVIFLLGAATLLLAHLQTGVMNAQSIPFSMALVPAALAGMWLGFLLQDRLDAERFRFWTLIVLMLVAANLIRRAIMG